MGRHTLNPPLLAAFSGEFTPKRHSQEIPRLQNQPSPLRLRRHSRTGKGGMNVPLSSTENNAIKSIKGSFSWVVGADGKVEAGIHGSAGLNSNPLKLFGLADTGFRAEGGMNLAA